MESFRLRSDGALLEAFFTPGSEAASGRTETIRVAVARGVEKIRVGGYGVVATDGSRIESSGGSEDSILQPKLDNVLLLEEAKVVTRLL